MARMGLQLQAWHWSTRRAASAADPSRSGRAV
jgi:hypothetical protein